MGEGETIKLRRPVTVGSQVLDELTFRRGRLGDLKGVTLEMPAPIATLMTIAGRLCGQPAAVIERIEEDDAAEVLGRAAAFFSRCLATGDEPSAP